MNRLIKCFNVDSTFKFQSLLNFKKLEIIKKLFLTSKINWIEVELEVNKTKKLEVEVETTGCNPISSSKGPRIVPPPMPSIPASKPEKKP